MSVENIQIEPISSNIGAEVSGFDFAEEIDDATAKRLRAAFRKYRLLLIRDKDLSAENQARFANIFGDVVIREDYDVEETKDDETQYVSNNRSDGILGKGELDFHHDQLFQADPLKALILYAIEIPDSGSETSFVHTARAYDAMPEDLRDRLEDKSCLHLYDFKGDYAGFQDPEKASPGSPRANHPILYREDGDDDTAVWVNRLTTIRVNELEGDDSQKLIDEVRSYLRDENIIYRHQWAPGDLLIWDNRMLQHARGPFDESKPRTLRRTPIM